MNINKKGTGGVALFFALVGLLLFFYILLLPAEDRQDIINEIKTKDKTLQTQQYTFTSFDIYTQTESNDLTPPDKESKSFTVQSALWNTKTEKFNLTVPTGTQNILLDVTEIKHNGNLIININNRTILNKEIEGIKTIIIDNLQDNNEIEIKTEPRTWWKIFGRNYYDIVIGIRANTILNDYSMETKTFEITNDKTNIQTANITYTVNCPETNTPVTPLTIKINNNIINEEQPQCSQTYNYEINKRNLYKGFNTLTFTTQPQGKYHINNLKINTQYYTK